MKVIAICESKYRRIRNHLDSFLSVELCSETRRVVLEHLLRARRACASYEHWNE